MDILCPRWVVFAWMMIGCRAVSGEPPATAPKVASHVVVLSIDGLRPDSISALAPDAALRSLIAHGSSTLNARSDSDFTITLPNHVSMLTGRDVLGSSGHHYTADAYPVLNIHETRGEYVTSVFDVVHAAGLPTAMFASKAKFDLFCSSYPSVIDRCETREGDDRGTMEAALSWLGAHLSGFTFIHLAQPDQTGHWDGWVLAPNSPYLDAVRSTDELVHRLSEAIERDPTLREGMKLIVTSDHGGSGISHWNAELIDDYRIPLIVWGEGVAQGADLYLDEADCRKDPGNGKADVDLPPIRSKDVARFATAALGLRTRFCSPID